VNLYFTLSARRQFLQALPTSPETLTLPQRASEFEWSGRCAASNGFRVLAAGSPSFPVFRTERSSFGRIASSNRVTGNAVWVVAVWHGAQLVKRPGRGARRPTRC
jgi:hypothetical protein